MSHIYDLKFIKELGEKKMSMTEWKKRERQERQNDIINAARKILANKDFSEVSMDEIARENGLGKSTLYLYFKNKESLYFAIVLRGIRIWVEMVKEEMKKSKRGVEKFSLYLNANQKFSKEYPDYFRLLYSPTSIKKQFDKNKMNSSAEFQEVRSLFKDLMNRGIEALKQGIDEGEIRAEVDPVETIILISVIYNGMANMGDWSKEILENRGIDEQKFSADVAEIFSQHLIKIEKK